MNLPKYLREGVEKQKSPDRLRRLAEYAEQMADWREAEAERELEERAEQDVDTTPDEWDADEWEDVVDDARDEADLAPGKGTLTTKTIDGRDYYYLQWRAGSKIKSQYVAPVTPADSGE
jgi:predicted phage gp36 major capsid-like protein